MKSGGGSGGDLGCGKSKRCSVVIGFDVCLEGNFFSPPPSLPPSLTIYIQYLVPLTKHPRQDKFVYVLWGDPSPQPGNLGALSVRGSCEGSEGSRVAECC